MAAGVIRRLRSLPAVIRRYCRSVAGAPTRSIPFWLRPKWVVGHVLVMVLVVAFVNLGFWQLRRLDEKRARNVDIQSRSSQPVAPVDEVIPPQAELSSVDGLVYRRATARGTYDAAATVLVRSRSLASRPGFFVLTPLVTADGHALIVNRGFAPFTEDPAEALAATTPPAGSVQVTGLLLGTQERQGIGPTDPPSGVLRQVNRVDLARLQQQYGAPLYPMYLQLSDQRPPQAEELPTVLPPPEQTEGPHVGYAVQWFLFAAVGAVGWPVLLRNTARERRQDGTYLSGPVADEEPTPEEAPAASEPVSPS